MAALFCSVLALNAVYDTRPSMDMLCLLVLPWRKLRVLGLDMKVFPDADSIYCSRVYSGGSMHILSTAA